MLKKKANNPKHLKMLIKEAQLVGLSVFRMIASKENFGNNYISLKNDAPCACCTKKLISIGFRYLLFNEWWFYQKDESKD